ncbi:hypothetical protein [Neisseria meningitidis]|nr:hypothetical protein [Neisseria meningitidis]
MSVADTVLLPPVELPFRDMADASFLLNRIRIPPNLTECKTAAGNGLYDTSTYWMLRAHYNIFPSVLKHLFTLYLHCGGKSVYERQYTLKWRFAPVWE